MENQESLENNLRARIAKCNRIILGLQSNDAFNEMLSDFKDQMERLDDSWQWITEAKLLSESQITKMAYLSIINCLDTYRNDMTQAEKQLTELEHPDEITGKDFDNEVVNAESDRVKVKKTRKKKTT